MKTLHLFLLTVTILLNGCASQSFKGYFNHFNLPNGETISREDFEKNKPSVVYKESKKEVFEVCHKKSNIACYSPSKETVFIRKNLKNEKEVIVHEWAHHVLWKKFPENLFLSTSNQEDLVHQLLRRI